MSEVKVQRCGGCGGPLPVASGSVVTCTYCGRELRVVGGAAAVQVQLGARTITDRLLSGYAGEDVGQARRLSVAEMEARAWRDDACALWPIGASASSTFGGSWSPDALVGPPRVFPRHGDIGGAWAPRSRDSHVEWIELRYPAGAPRASAIRVFETNLPGASFAITLLDAGGEELLWQRRPEHTGNVAQVLELELVPPRRVERLRVYVNNEIGTGWSEIDTVGLVTVEPVPASMRVVVPPPSRAGRVFGWIALALIAAAIAVVVAAVNAEGPPPTPVPARASQVVAGSLMVWNVTAPVLQESGITWASELVAFSSQYSTSASGAHRALGAPDVFPRHADSPAAWAPAERDAGLEFVDLRFAPTRASAVVIVETMNPGALARVEDISAGRPAVVLWEGTSAFHESARVLTVELAEPRTIDAVRVVLDTRRVAGWNELDAVGLFPAR